MRGVFRAGVEELCGHFYLLCEKKARHLLGLGVGSERCKRAESAGREAGDWQWAGKTGRTGRIAGRAGEWGPGGREKELLRSEQRERRQQDQAELESVSQIGFH